MSHDKDEMWAQSPQMNQLPSKAKLSSQQLEEISKKSFRAMFKNRNSKIGDILQERIVDVFSQKRNKKVSGFQQLGLPVHVLNCWGASNS